MKRICCGEIIALLLAFVQPGLGQVAYSITDLGTPSSGEDGSAAGINDAGQIVGSAGGTGGGNTTVFLWNPGSGFANLGPLPSGSTESFASGVNDLGDIVGNLNNSTGFLWTAQSGYQALFSLNTPTGTLVANNINNSGTIIGGSGGGSYELSAGTSNATPLAFSSGWSSTTANDINSNGEVVGTASDISGDVHALIWTTTSNVEDLSSLANGIGGYGTATGINDAGLVVGTEGPPGNQTAYIWSAATGVQNLGALSGAKTSAPSGINSSGEVVGTSNYSGFVWTSQGGMVNLNTASNAGSAGWTIIGAAGINNLGQIAANGTNSAGQEHPLLLRPYLVTTLTTQTPVTELTTVYKPTINNLEVFNPSTGAFEGSQNGGTVNVNLPTVVLTLGFNETVSGANAWPISIAQDLPGAGTKYNVVAWDWSADADTNNLPLANSRTASEGAALGETLSTLFGSTYTGAVHFFGHSLGTLVDSEAITVLNAHDPGAQIQDTLFDEASIANNIPGAAPAYPVSAIPLNAKGNVIPERIDNYISSFGEAYSQAANFILQNDPSNPPAPLNPQYWINFHTYPESWYQQTLPNQADQSSPIGYAGAIEGNDFDLSDPYYQEGTYWAQSTQAGGEYSFSQKTVAEASQLLQTRNNQQLALLDVAGVISLVPELGGVLNLGVAHYFGVSVSQLTGAVQYENSVAANLVLGQNGSESILAPQIVLTKQPNAAMATIRSAGTNTAISSDDQAPTSSSYAWMPIAVPTGVQYLAMDFTFHDLSSGDFLTIGINDTPLFQLEDEFVTDGIAENTGLIDISQWAGEDVQLFLGLNAADDLNPGGTITIDNISFVSVPEPTSLISLIAMGLGMLSRRASRCTKNRLQTIK